MFILYAVIIGLLWSYLRKGRIRYLTDRPIKWKGLAIGAFGIQLVIFSDLPFVSAFSQSLLAACHILSYVMILIFVFLNRRDLGICILGIGVLLNFIAILSNGGYMPTTAENLRMTSMAEHADALEQGKVSNNSVAMTGETLFPFLSDIFVLPAWLPLSNVFSIGDVLIGIGVCIYLIRNMQPPISEKKPKKERLL